MQEGYLHSPGGIFFSIYLHVGGGRMSILIIEGKRRKDGKMGEQISFLEIIYTPAIILPFFLATDEREKFVKRKASKRINVFVKTYHQPYLCQTIKFLLVLKLFIKK